MNILKGVIQYKFDIIRKMSLIVLFLTLYLLKFYRRILMKDRKRRKKLIKTRNKTRKYIHKRYYFQLTFICQNVSFLFAK